MPGPFVFLCSCWCHFSSGEVSVKAPRLMVANGAKATEKESSHCCDDNALIMSVTEYY